MICSCINAVDGQKTAECFTDHLKTRNHKTIGLLGLTFWQQSSKWRVNAQELAVQIWIHPCPLTIAVFKWLHPVFLLDCESETAVRYPSTLQSYQCLRLCYSDCCAASGFRSASAGAPLALWRQVGPMLRMKNPDAGGEVCSPWGFRARGATGGLAEFEGFPLDLGKVRQRPTHEIQVNVCLFLPGEQRVLFSVRPVAHLFISLLYYNLLLD